MAQVCSAINCRNRATKENGISLFMFPREDHRMEQWCLALKRDKWKPSKHSKVCSAHFTEDCFVTNAWSSRPKLSETAVPSIFTFPEHLVKTPHPRKPPAVWSAQAEKNATILEPQVHNMPSSGLSTSEYIVPEPVPKTRRLSYLLGDVVESHESIKLKKVQETLKQAIHVKSKELRISRQRNRRFQRRIQSLESSVEHLIKEQMTSEEAASILLTYRHSPPGHKEDGLSPAASSSPNLSPRNDLLATTNMSVNPYYPEDVEMIETIIEASDVETEDVEYKHIEFEHKYTKSPDTADEETYSMDRVKAEKLTPPPSPPGILDEQFEEKHPLKKKKKRKRRAPPIPDSVTPSPFILSRSEIKLPDVMGGTGLKVECEKDMTPFEQSQRIKQLEQENKQLKTKMYHYQNLLKEMGVIVNMSFVESHARSMPV